MNTLLADNTTTDRRAPDWAEEDRARADHYAVLARLFFAAPDADLLAALVRTGRAFAGSGPLAAAWQGLAAIAAATTPEQVQTEFDQLFVGIGRPEVMLYGSFYQTGFLMEEPLADLRSDLARLGLGRRVGIAESEDHIAALAEVMRHLIVTGPDAAGLARQRAFFDRHVRSWNAALTEALVTHSAAVFYARVGALARAFFDVEVEAFSMV